MIYNSKIGITFKPTKGHLENKITIKSIGVLRYLSHNVIGETTDTIELVDIWLPQNLLF